MDARNKINFPVLILLFIAGEAIFFLPFVLPRIFRLTLLQVFDLSNSELGDLFSVYGLVAIGCYFLGGPVADRFKARWLLSGALIITGISGFYLASIPPKGALYGLYAFYGVSTIMLFWAAMLRATRDYGGVGNAPLAYGILDGGRGLIAALIGFVAVGLLQDVIPTDAGSITPEERKEAFQVVIYFFSSFVVLAGLAVLFALRTPPPSAAQPRFEPSQVWKAIKMPAVWKQSLIILCAYSAYRVTDAFPALAETYLNMNESAAAAFTSQLLWVRPLGAIAGGILGTSIRTSRLIVGAFAIIFLCGLLVGFGASQVSILLPFLIIIMAMASSIYALRGLYFAVMEEMEIPIAITGTVVGIASIVGFLPDVYMAKLIGVFLDDFPGKQGHQYVYLSMAGFALVGGVTALTIARRKA
ncbi:MFS transporter [Sanyastnella coralliicola]|uniref:MFS transporter n=1 Tax=Sanyastnella coralliicola TaxID=3069118 RepID=UPI0027BA3ED2|nr:MFS transporter [Longitalea sp. SCSIO 12813]